jgi:hypothetical protein
MTINFYSIVEDPRTMPKTLPEPVTVTGRLRDEQVDVMHPSILMTGAPSQVYNYAYLPDFNRYYFVDPPITVRTGLVRLQLHVDVLQTYYAGIMTAPVILDRVSDGYNAFVPDSRRKFYAYTEPQYKKIGSLGDSYSLVMVASGYPRT